MKQLSLLTALCLMSGCVSANTKVSSATDSATVPDSIKETSGVTLEKTSGTMIAMRIEEVSPKAKFNRVVPLQPGDSMLDAYQPAEILPEKDCIVGVDGRMAWDSTGALSEAVTDAFGKNSPQTIQVLRVSSGKIQNVVAGSGNLLSDLRTSFATVAYPSLTIASVVPGSWAEKNGLRVGDKIVGTIRLQTVAAKRSRFLFMTYASNEKSSREIPAGDIAETDGLLNKMFREIKPYQPTKGNEDGLMGESVVLKLSVIRDSKLLLKSLPRSRHVGLGVMFDCQPYCAGAKPVIKAMRKNSPGERAGLKLEDLALAIDGKKVNSSWDIVKKMRKLNYGDSVTFRVLRNDKVVDVTAKLDWVTEE